MEYSRHAPQREPQFARTESSLYPTARSQIKIKLYAIWHAVIKTLVQGGVSWRDRFYPLETLKRGQRSF